jgi:hypothetical protein
MTDTKQTTGRMDQGDDSDFSLLDLIARSRSKEFLERKKEVEEGPYHPTEELLREYVLDELDESDAEIIMDHLSLCGPCAREALRLTWALQDQTESWWARPLELVTRSLSFSMSIHALCPEFVRGVEPEPQQDRYTLGSDLFISMEAPADGYVTVFHGCEETLRRELVFPLYFNDDPKVGEGWGLLPFSRKVEGPRGKHWLNVFWTRVRAFDPEGLDPNDEIALDEAVEGFFDLVESLPSEDWRSTIKEYEVEAE